MITNYNQVPLTFIYESDETNINFMDNEEALIGPIPPEDNQIMRSKLELTCAAPNVMPSKCENPLFVPAWKSRDLYGFDLAHTACHDTSPKQINRCRPNGAGWFITITNNVFQFFDECLFLNLRILSIVATFNYFLI